MQDVTMGVAIEGNAPEQSDQSSNATDSAASMALARTDEYGFPLNADGEWDVTAMSPQQIVDFWAFIDAKKRAANDLLGAWLNAAKREAELRIQARRANNPNAIEIPHPSLTVRLKDDFTPYGYDESLLDEVKALLGDDFAKVATWKERFVPEPVEAHWEIKPTAHATISAYIERWDGTPEGDLLKRFMTRQKTGESLTIEYKKGAKTNVTPIRGAA